MLRRIIFTMIALLALAGTAWALWPKPLTVETAVIDRRTIDVSVEDEGKSRVREVFTVSAPITGRLMRLTLHPGDNVVASETVIASIRPTEPVLLDARTRLVAEATQQAAAAQVDLAASQLREAEAQLPFLKTQLDRANALIERGTISEQAYQKAELDVTVAQTQIDSAQANLIARQNELKSASAALSEGTVDADPAHCCVEVRAPVSGRVLNVTTESEQVVQAGTPLLDIGDPEDLEVVVNLLSRDAVQINKGAMAMIDGWGGPPLRAEVASIEPAAVTKVSALGIEEQRVTAVLRLLDPLDTRQRLGHGFRVVAHISVWRGDNLVAVPVGALFRQGTSWAVFTDTNGAAHLQPIELGQRNADFAEVTSGLQPGAVVILHPSDQLTDGKGVSPSP